MKACSGGLTKAIFAACALTLLAAPSRARAEDTSAPCPSAAPSPSKDAPAPPDPREADRARSLYMAGVGTTLVGIGVGAGFTAFTIVGLADASLSGLGTSILGGIGVGTGLVISAIGVPMWVAGRARLSRAERASSLSLVPTFAPVAGGAMAGFGATF